MGFLFSVASEVYFEEAEGNKKPTREAGCGFHACTGLPIRGCTIPRLRGAVNSSLKGNKKQNSPIEFWFMFLFWDTK